MKQRGWRRLLAALFALLVIGLVGAWLIGQWRRDATLLTALCFYIPSPLLLVTLLVGSGVCHAVRLRYAGRGLLALAAMPLVSIALVENQWATPPPAEDAVGTPVRVVHWNVMWGELGWPAIAKQLVELDADAYVLSEVGAGFDFSAFEGYEVAADWSMAIVARGELGELQRRYNKLEIRELWIDWRPIGLAESEDPLRVMLVDISAQPRLHRRPTIDLVRRNLAELQPDLVMGDFNSPRLSIGLTPPPPGYRHAYDAVGSGWSYTWPVPAPVLAIDQTLIGERLAPKRYRLETTWLSDHRRQVFDATIRRTAASR